MKFSKPSLAHLLFLPALVLVGCGEDGVRAAVERAAFDPETLDFGEVTVGLTASRTVQLRNVGTVTIEILSVETAPSFSVRGAKGPLEGVLITAGSSLELEVLFLAMAEGEKTGVITVYTEKTQAELQVRGLGVAKLVPDLKIEPRALNFGTVVVGQESKLAVTIRNDGSAPGTITGASLETAGALGLPFNLEAGANAALPGITVQPGQSAEYMVVFSPLYEGPIVDVMIFAAQAPAQALSLSIQGNGAPARGGLVCTPSALNFGAVERGQVATQQVTCSASGGITRFVSAGFPASQTLFQVAAQPGTYDLAEGESMSFTAELHAEGAPAVHTDTLSVQYDGANGLATLEIPVRGEVVPPPVTATAMSFILTWDTNFTDVDMHLVRPGSSIWDTNDGDCYFGERSPDWGVQDDPTDDPYLDKDDVDGYGPEEINLNVAAPGDYELYIHYFADNDLGASTAAVQVHIAGNLVGTFNRNLYCNDTWHAGTVSWNGSTGTFTPTVQVQASTRGFCF
jgi:hypothetical protein